MTFTKYGLSTALFALVGLGAAALALGYRVGSLRDMGPGMFPLSLGILITLVATIYLVATHRSSAPKERVTFNEGKPLVLILGSVVAFGLLLEPFGLVVALCTLVLGCWLANADRKIFELPLMMVLFNGLAYVIFIRLLNVPIRLGPL